MFLLSLFDGSTDPMSDLQALKREADLLLTQEWNPPSRWAGCVRGLLDAVEGLEKELASLRERGSAESRAFSQAYNEGTALHEQLYQAWVVIANVSEGNWDDQTAEWKEAAIRWRDKYHEILPQASDL